MRKLVVVDTYSNPLDAHIARGLRESEGIPATLGSEHHVWSSWPYALALGGIRLQVAERHGSGDFRYTRSLWSIVLLLATFGLSSVIFPPRITGRQCNACRKTVAQ